MAVKTQAVPVTSYTWSIFFVFFVPVLLMSSFLEWMLYIDWIEIFPLELKWMGGTFRTFHTWSWKLNLFFHKLPCKRHVFFFLTLQSVCRSDSCCSPGLSDIMMTVETTSFHTIRKYNTQNSWWQTAWWALMACGQECDHYHGTKELTLVQVMVICCPLMDNWSQIF